jgi:hypothetical protein
LTDTGLYESCVVDITFDRYLLLRGVLGAEDGSQATAANQVITARDTA